MSIRLPLFLLLCLITAGNSATGKPLESLHISSGQWKNSALCRLGGGAKMEENLLSLDGAKASVTLINSQDFNVSEKGLTIAGILRMDSPSATSSRKDNNMLIACKPGAWFLGRTGDQFNFSFCTDGQNWNNALFGGEYPELNEWMHVSAVFERMNESAQGNVGYCLKIYLNGELLIQKQFLYAEPTASSHPVLLGNGNFPDYGFRGKMARFDLFARGLNEGEIGELATKAQKSPPLATSGNASTSALQIQLEKLAGSTRNPEIKSIAMALKQGLLNGLKPENARAFLQNSSLQKSSLTGKALAEAWNKENKVLKLLYSPEATLLLHHGTGNGNFPILGIYSPQSRQNILDGRGFGWTLDFDGRRIHDRSYGVSYQVRNLIFTSTGGNFQIQWQKAKDFECISDFTFENGRLEQTLQVNNLRNGNKLTSVTFPQHFLRQLPGKKDQLVFPLFSGVLHQHPTRGFSTSGLYPTARAAMQFIPYFDELNNGIYSAFEATDGAVKTLSANGRNNVLECKWSNPVSTVSRNSGEILWQSTGPGVLQVYQGDWFEGGQIYKKFVEQRAPWAVKELPRKDTPEWYRDNALWIIISPNTRYAAPILRDYFDIPYAIWFCRWADIDPNADVIPKPGAIDALNRFASKGIYLHPYMNARLYAYPEGSIGYHDQSESPMFKNESIQRRDGTIYKEQYGNDKYAVMCTGSQPWRERLLKNAAVSANNGFRGVYWDQLPCGSAQLCWNTAHGHAPGDPAVWGNGYRLLLQDIREKFPQLALDGEDNSEIYVNRLDGFMSWRFTEPGHVPLFQSIYGGGRTQFTGRGFDTFGSGPGSYEATFAKLGEQFVFGEQIGWFHIYDIRWGTPRRMYAKKLAHLRKALLGYLNEADMLRPIAFAKPVPQMTCVWGNTRGKSVTTDKVLSGAWKRIRDGKILHLFTNTTDEEITVFPTTRYTGMDKLSVCMEGAQVADYIDLKQSPLPAVKLPPYASCVWIFGKEFDKDEAESIAKVTAQIAQFKDGGPSLIDGPVPTHISKKITAKQGQWITAMDASFVLNGFCEGNRTLGYNPSGTPEERGGWILLRDNGAISFGQVDFSAVQGNAFEIKLAVTKENAGGKVKLCKVDKERKILQVLAELSTTPTKGWFTFDTFQIPCPTITGKHFIEIHFEKECNFQGWRINQ